MTALLCGLGLSLASTLILIVALAPPARAYAAVGVYPPWWSAGRTWSAAAASGLAVAPGRVPYLIIARSFSPDAVRRLKGTGALFVLNLPAGACGEGRSI